MTLNEKIAYAEGRKAQATEDGSPIAEVYWHGYEQGLKELRDEQERERMEKFKALLKREPVSIQKEEG